MSSENNDEKTGEEKRAEWKVKRSKFSDEADFRTPQAVFDDLNERFGPFTLDAAASKENALVGQYYDEQADGLEQEWSGKVWCNPPYGRGLIAKWVKKGYEAVAGGLAQTVALLIPAYPDLGYWHDYIFPKASHLVFFRARIDFSGPFSTRGGASKNPSCCVVFSQGHSGVGIRILTMYRKGGWLIEENWDRETFEIRLRNGVFAKGRFLDEDKMVVQRGSTANLKMRSHSCTYEPLRSSLIEEGALVADGDRLRFTRDVTFGSPSAAASVVRAAQSNGRKIWKETSSTA